MAKNKILNITSALSTKYKMPLKEAEAFVAMVFDVVNDGLMKDKLVKVKGLGTFKVASVKDRESVNVNTGERVLIEGHDKVTFTPDAALRDFVNKPFAQFETVVVKDGVDFSDLDYQKVTENPDALVSPVAKSQEKQETPESSEVQEETTKPVEETKQQTRTEQPQAVQPQSCDVAAPQKCSSKNLLLACLLVVITFIAGFFIGRGTAGEADKQAAPETTTETPADSVKSSQPAAKQDAATSFEAYNSDPRIKYGAYDIVGIDTVIELRPGQTLQSVCRVTLGADMISYLEVMNDEKSLETGKVKVPKLKVRNSKK